MAHIIKVKPEKNRPIDDSSCPECNGKDFEYYSKHDETICKSCGLVLQGPPGYSGYIQLYYPWGHVYDTGEIQK